MYLKHKIMARAMMDIARILIIFSAKGLLAALLAPVRWIIA